MRFRLTGVYICQTGELHRSDSQTEDTCRLAFFYGGTSEMGFKSWMGAEKWVIRSLTGNVYIDNGSLTVAGTNTAAEVRSTGGYIIGPYHFRQAGAHLHGRHELLFSLTSIPSRTL